MMRTFLAALTLALVLTVHLATVLADQRPSPPAFVVIVNAANPSSSLGRKFVADAFLKKATRWPGGEVIRPVDQNADATVRAKFDEDVLGRSVAAVKSYWQQIIFSGRDVPPPELNTDDDVLKFVLKNSSAIGYVSGTAHIDGAKTVSLQ